MTNCEHYIELISARLDGPLPPAETEALDAHLAQCPHCRALNDQLAGIRDAFSDLEDIPAPAGFAQGVMDKIHALEKPAPKVVPLFQGPRLKALASLAACAVLVVGLSGLLPKGPADDGDTAAGSASVSNQSALPDSPRSAADPEAAANIALYDTLERDPQAQSDSAPQTHQVAGYQVSAILTLDALPDEAALDTQYLTDETGRQVWIVTPEQLDALLLLAQEQNITASLTGTPTDTDPCALILAK